jgi:hypothetical protein
MVTHRSVPLGTRCADVFSGLQILTVCVFLGAGVEVTGLLPAYRMRGVGVYNTTNCYLQFTMLTLGGSSLFLKKEGCR